MPNKPNWRRNQEKEENSEYYYIWTNKSWGTEIRIYKNAFDVYNIDVRGAFDGKWAFRRISGWSNREDAKQYALQIQENYPRFRHPQYPMVQIRHGRDGFEKKKVERIVSPWHSFEDDHSYTMEN